MQFEFATAHRIVFGRGKLREIGPIAKSFGSRALVVTGRNNNRARPLLTALQEAGLTHELFAIPGEPSVHDIRRGTDVAKSTACDFVVGFGGGSAMDAAKAISAMMTNPGDLLDYLEVIGKAQPLTRPAAPCVVLPTTAGTGTEVTRNAVLASPEHRFKVSLRGPFVLPRVALIDPELTMDLPPDVTAFTGLDALTQLIEPFTSHRANPFTDAFCRDGLPRIARSLRIATSPQPTLHAREDMALASLYSGLSLANAALGAVHGFAAPLGGMFSAPHGAICAALLPHTMQVNVRALQSREPANPALERYAEVARMLTQNRQATVEYGIQWVRDACQQLKIAGLGKLGIRREEFSEITEKASKASSMKGNPIVLSHDEMLEILELSF